MIKLSTILQEIQIKSYITPNEVLHLRNKIVNRTEFDVDLLSKEYLQSSLSRDFRHSSFQFIDDLLLKAPKPQLLVYYRELKKLVDKYNI